MILPLLLAASPHAVALALTPLDPATVVFAPSPAARAAIDGAGGGGGGGVVELPATPRGFAFQCRVEPKRDQFQGCLSLDDGAKPATDTAEFERRLDARYQVPLTTIEDRWRSIAERRVRLYVLKPSTGAPTTVRVVETVSTADRPVLGPATGRLDATKLVIEERPDGDAMASYYPPAARRAGLQVHLAVLCRVRPDRTLFCRDAYYEPLPAEPDAKDFLPEFAIYAYQYFAYTRVGRVSAVGELAVGRDVVMHIGFNLP